MQTTVSILHTLYYLCFWPHHFLSFNDHFSRWN